MAAELDAVAERRKQEFLARCAASIERERTGAPPPPQTPLQREQAKLQKQAPVWIGLLPARKDDELVYGDDGFVYESEDEPEPQPIVVPASYVRELNEFARKVRLVQTRFQRQRVRCQTRKRERRPRRTRRGGGRVAARAGPLAPSDDPPLARTIPGAR
jgi:hypothetical protein